MQRFRKTKPGIETRKITNFVEDILNDPQEFDPKSFKTQTFKDGSMVVYGIRWKDGKRVLHKVMTPKTKK